MEISKQKNFVFAQYNTIQTCIILHISCLCLFIDFLFFMNKIICICLPCHLLFLASKVTFFFSCIFCKDRTKNNEYFTNMLKTINPNKIMKKINPQY